MLNDTQIGRLQLHTGPNQPAACQADVARQLRQTRLQPAHLPRGAILVIRQLTSHRSSDIHRGNVAAWTKQLQQQVDELARQAARPYKQGASESAQSVLFLDSVELLICFTKDLLAKRPMWYWQELFPDLSLQATSFTTLGEMMTAAWIAYPEALPGTLVQLPKPLVAEALGTVTRTQLQRVIAALHQHFGLEVRSSHNQELGAVESSIVFPSGSPWQAWFRVETITGMAPLAIYLLGVSYLLANAPHLAHAPTFVAEAAKWITLEEAAVEGNEESLHSTQASTQESTSLDKEFTHEAKSDNGKEQAEEGINRRDDQPHSILDAAARIADPQSDISTEPRVALDSVQTQLGGAFYLLNVIAWLEAKGILPKDQPMDPWLGVATLMVELLGDQRDQLRAEPLWALLEMLANQPAGAFWRTLDQSSFSSEPSDELAFAIQWWQAQFQQLIVDQLTQRLTQDREALAKLFCVPAHVRTTNTHIDVLFPNDAVSIDIRRSGLDRSPGWVPIFGYIVTFIFD